MLLALESLFVPLALKIKLRADVTPRSSHKVPSVTGGGFIFFVAAVSLTAVNFGEVSTYAGFIKMAVGATVLFLISLADDWSDLSPLLRLVVQTAVVAYVFADVATNGYYDIYLLILICGVGFINGFNFMDGINGMLAAYSTVTLSTMLLLYGQCQWRWGAEVPEMLITVELVAVAVFALFNFRRRALCFAGDVGSIVMGFFIVWLTVSYIILTADASIIVFLSVYGIDVVFTILQRLFRGDDILTSHRLHLYQLLVNEKAMPHLKVSVIYASVQAVVNVGWFVVDHSLRWTYVIFVVIVLSVLYLTVKRKIGVAGKYDSPSES